MQDEIDLELKRLTEIFGREEAAAPGDEIDLEELKRLVEICQTDSGAPEELPDGEIERLLALYGEPADSSATDGEIEAEWLEKVKDWQRADEENEPARLEAEARAARELDELVERFRDE